MLRDGLHHLRDTFEGNHINDLVVAEVGVHRGENALSMLEGFRSIHKLYLIDNNPECINMARDEFKPYEDKIEWITKDSVAAAKGFPDETFDFVYIDADHRYNLVVEDIKVWWPKVKKGGYLIGHDYGNETPEVTQAVDDTLEDFWIKGEWFKKKEL